MDTADVVDKIVLLEWDMFRAVNEGGPRALCQEDRLTFEGMRRAQFLCWSPDAAASYLEDLESAVSEGRNLVNEKYIHMMEYSAPDLYEALKRTIPLPGDSQIKLAKEISDKMLDETAALYEKYPFVSGCGRPLRSEEDASGITSVETYQLGELLSYSEKTLTLLKAHLMKLAEEGSSLAKNILEKSVGYYGYATLEDAEASARANSRCGPENGCDGCCTSCR